MKQRWWWCLRDQTSVGNFAAKITSPLISCSNCCFSSRSHSWARWRKFESIVYGKPQKRKVNTAGKITAAALSSSRLSIWNGAYPVEIGQVFTFKAKALCPLDITCLAERKWMEKTSHFDSFVAHSGFLLFSSCRHTDFWFQT